MNQRNALALIGLLVAALAACVFVVVSINHCPTTVSNGVCLAPKDPGANPTLPEDMPKAPAPAGAAENEPPAGPIIIDHDLKEFDGFTGKSAYWEKTSSSTTLVGIEITQEGYGKLLAEIGYKKASPPSTAYLTPFAAKSIGHSSDDPATKFILLVK